MKLFSPQYDKKGNNINRTSYESFLSKVIIENERFIRPVFDKINAELMHVAEIFAAHQDNVFFKNCLDHIKKGIQFRYPNLSPTEFFKEGQISDFIECYKFWFENELFRRWSKTELPEIKDSITNSSNINNTPKTLSELVQAKIKSEKFGIIDKKTKEFQKIEITEALVRPGILFNDRGRLPVNSFEKSSDIGIMTPETTPDLLRKKSDIKRSSAKLSSKPDYKSSVVKNFRAHNIPFIAGASGTVGFTLRAILNWSKNNFSNITFTPSELKMLAMGLAADMTYKGHHSFYESMIIFKSIGFKIELIDDHKKFYEQFLTEEFKQSDEYQKFLSEHDYIEETMVSLQRSNLNG